MFRTTAGQLEVFGAGPACLGTRRNEKQTGSSSGQRVWYSNSSH